MAVSHLQPEEVCETRPAPGFSGMSLRLLTSCRLFRVTKYEGNQQTPSSLWLFTLVSHLFYHIFVRKLLFLFPITVNQPRLRVHCFKGRVMMMMMALSVRL